MKILKIEIARNHNVKFSWKFHRLTLKCNPAIYHWLWLAFGKSSEGRKVMNQKERKILKGWKKFCKDYKETKLTPEERKIFAEIPEPKKFNSKIINKIKKEIGKL